MREDFLHYLWKHKKINPTGLKTTNREEISIISVGEHNENSGPDFFNAQIRIANQLWAGNVEIHLKSSDWYIHKHESDKAYDNVILHVVWEHDTEVYRADNTTIATLRLNDVVDKDTLENYRKLFSKTKRWINCEPDFASVSDFVFNNWLERLYFERLEQKSKHIESLLQASNNNWEAVLFKMLTKNFGLKVNGESFLSLANSFHFKTFRKLTSNVEDLEALLFGQAGLLEGSSEDVYQKQLKNKYNFLVSKYKIDNTGVLPLKFFRLRPLNFPTIRLSQLANLYHQEENLFSKILELKTKEDYYKLFNITTSSYWKTHYNFGKDSKASTKNLSKAFIDLLLINTIIPLKFCYLRSLGNSKNDEILDVIREISIEKNSVVNRFMELRTIGKSALESQSLLQLKTQYCSKNQCLKCAVGNSLIKG